MKNTSRSTQLYHYLTAVLVCVFSAFAFPLQADSNTGDSAGNNVVLVLGDSISAAYGLATEDGWVAQLQQQLQQSNLPLTVVNASVTGDTTANGLSRLPALLTRHQPSLVIIELGGNDGLRGLSIKHMKQNLLSMATLAKEARSEVIIVAVQLPNNYGKAYNRLFSAAFTDTANDTNSALVPSLFAGMSATSKWFQEDGIHPSAVAQPVMLDNIWQVAEPILTKIEAAR